MGKRVNKTQAKFKKNTEESDSAKAAAFRSGLKTSGAGPDSKFTMDDGKEDKDKPELTLRPRKQGAKAGSNAMFVTALWVKSVGNKTRFWAIILVYFSFSQFE